MIAARLSVKIQTSRLRPSLLQCCRACSEPVGYRIARRRTLPFGVPWGRSFPLQVEWPSG